MTTDIGSWAIKDYNRYVAGSRRPSTPVSCLDAFPSPSLSQPSRSGEPGFQNTDNSNTPSKRRRHSSELARLYSANSASGVPSGSTAQMPLSEAPFASSSRYQMGSQDIGKEGVSYALSDTRSSYFGAEVSPFASMQLLPDQDAGNRLNSIRSSGARGQDFPTAYVPTQMMDPVPAAANMTGDTPSSLQAASVAVMSAPTTRSTPVSGSMQARLFDGTPLQTDTRSLYDNIGDVSGSRVAGTARLSG